MILTSGTLGYNQIGPERYIPGGWGLDQIEVKMQGARENLLAYITSLTQWAACPFDGNLYLSEFPNDNHVLWPTVTLTYIGRFGGTMPAIKRESDTVYRSGSSTQTLGYSSSIFGTIKFTYTVHIFYYCPQNRIRWISDTENGGADAEDPSTDPVVVKLTTDVAGLLPYEVELPANLQEIVISEFFTKIITIEPQAVELVPGKYWQNSQSRTLVLLSKIIPAPAPAP